MTYYQLPRNNFFTYKYIDYIETNEQPRSIISPSQSDYLYEIKKHIGLIEKDWDIFKKYTNPYEYIHTNIPHKNKYVATCNPLSRSYFKMIEIMKIFKLEVSSKPIRSFHLAEGPGGFIEALCKQRKCKYDKYIGMTILDDKHDPNIPAWKKTRNFLNQNKNVVIENGEDGTGNILSMTNFMYCATNYASCMDLITGDGGFDFSSDFNNQESHIANLLFAQMAFALVMQKQGGCFILKIFDSFMHHTVDLLYILSSFYERVSIVKPHTSRYANSEKYVVCKGFIFPNNQVFLPFLCRAFEKMTTKKEGLHIHRFLSIPINAYFLNKLEELNAIFGQQQIENIHYTVSLIENKHKQEKINNLIKNNLRKCVNWCMKHNVDYNVFDD
jgi:23S rRNA U2552 (ribose-2'-O)-methylase RlmE/FtsJ